MTSIGFVESNDAEKASVVKSMISDIKRDEVQKGIVENSFVKFDGEYGKVSQIILKGGARLSTEEIVHNAKADDPVTIIKVYSQKDGTIVPTNRRVIKNISSLEKVNAISKSEVKEVSKMNSDIVVVDEIEKSMDMNEEQINPEPTALPVEEADATVSTEKAIEVEIEEEDETEEDATDTEEEGKMYDDAMKAEEPEVTKADNSEEVTKSISDISETLTSALTTLAETVKALDAKIEGINKSVAGLSDEVNVVKDSFGKRVDAVEKDTAFRKSADLGEILQEEPVQIMEKSMWGGRFLTNADL
jgi:hypothetical protein